MTITISGQPHTVDAASGAVQEIIAGGNPFGMNAPPNFAGGASACEPDSCTATMCPMCFEVATVESYYAVPNRPTMLCGPSRQHVD